MVVGETQHFRKFPHDTALDFLDGWLGFMWDVFFFFWWRSWRRFLAQIFKGEKTTWLVSGRGSILGGWGIDDCKWSPFGSPR